MITEATEIEMIDAASPWEGPYVGLLNLTDAEQMTSVFIYTQSTTLSVAKPALINVPVNDQAEADTVCRLLKLIVTSNRHRNRMDVQHDVRTQLFLMGLDPKNVMQPFIANLLMNPKVTIRGNSWEEMVAEIQRRAEDARQAASA